jgi:nitric oxide reductase NorQ protein
MSITAKSSLNMSQITPLPFYAAQHAEVELFEHAAKNRLPLLIKGPTGCGKTRFIEHMAAKLNRPLYTVACHDDLSASDLVGRHLINHAGTYWQDGPLTRAVREGGICYLDEVVEARKDTTVILHPLADNRRILPIERTGELLEAHPDFLLVISYNPGYQSFLKGLKPSTRQRFIALQLDYPEPALEALVVSQEAGVDMATAERLVKIGNALRRIAEHDIEEGASTRLLIYAGKLIHSGMPEIAALRSALAEPLSDDSETVKSLYDVIQSHIAG